MHPRSRDPHSLPPEVRALISMQHRTGRLSRRSLLRGAGALGLGAFLAACGTPGSGAAPAPSAAGGPTGAPGPAPAADVSDTEKTVAWANWTLYLDYDDETKTYPTLEAFKQQSGSTPTTAEDIDGNDTYFGKIQGQLATGQDIGQDIMSSPTGWPARMVRLGYTQELDHGEHAERRPTCCRPCRTWTSIPAGSIP